MSPATAKQIKDELKLKSEKELMELCARLVRFKKENKELLTYLLFEEKDEWGYIQSIKERMDQGFDDVNRWRMYLAKKTIRKILKEVKKFIRYSGKKDTEVELLIYFCTKLKAFIIDIGYNKVLLNLYDRQIELIKKRILSLHEDLQYDYTLELKELEEN